MLRHVRNLENILFRELVFLDQYFDLVKHEIIHMHQNGSEQNREHPIFKRINLKPHFHQQPDNLRLYIHKTNYTQITLLHMEVDNRMQIEKH